MSNSLNPNKAREFTTRGLGTYALIGLEAVLRGHDGL